MKANEAPENISYTIGNKYCDHCKGTGRRWLIFKCSYCSGKGYIFGVFKDK